MKIIDNKLRLFGKISLLDILAVLIVIALVFFASLKLMRKDVADITLGKTTEKYEATLYLYEDKGNTDCIRVGDQLGEMKNHFEIFVKDIKREDFYVNTVDDNGEVIKAIDPLKEKTIVTIEGDFSHVNNSLKFGKQELRLGSTIFLESDNYRLSALIADRKKVD